MRSLLREFTRELMIYKSRFLLFRKSQFAQITTGGPMSKYEYKKMYLAIYLCLIVDFAAKLH